MMVFVVMMLFVEVIMPVCGMMAVFVVMVLLKGVVVPAGTAAFVGLFVMEVVLLMGVFMPAGTTAFFCMKKRLQPHSL